MKRPIVIVDPTSSGVELAPTFMAREVPAIAVTLAREEFPEFGSTVKETDFIKVIPPQAGLAEILRKYHPLAVIPGTEEGIPLAEELTLALTPKFANDPKKSLHRSHKALMQKALHEAHLPFLKTLDTSSESEAEAWIKENSLQGAPLILKPPMSSGSEMVFHIDPHDDWTKAFRHILSVPSVLSGQCSETVVIQEQAIGQEYAVGTVSAHGKHHLVHLMKYNKVSSAGRKTVFDHVEFVPHDEGALDGIFQSTQKILDALGVRFGASHTEIMLTKDGPRLIESSPRMIGGPVVSFARTATGSSQADKLAEIYIDGDVQQSEFVFKKTVVPVFLKAPRSGLAKNLEILNETAQLPTYFNRYLWVKNGDRVPQTVDYLTSIGIVALAGDRDAIFLDYKKIRALEAQLEFEP